MATGIDEAAAAFAVSRRARGGPIDPCPGPLPAVSVDGATDGVNHASMAACTRRGSRHERAFSCRGAGVQPGSVPPRATP